MSKTKEVASFSQIGFGYSLVVSPQNDEPHVTKRIAQSAWGLFTMSWTDLFELKNASDEEKPLPLIGSLKCVRIETRKKDLVR